MHIFRKGNFVYFDSLKAIIVQTNANQCIQVYHGSNIKKIISKYITIKAIG